MGALVRKKEGRVKVKGWIKVVDHLMNSEFNDARSWEEVDSEAGVCCEDCCVVTENCQLWVAHPRYLGNKKLRYFYFLGYWEIWIIVRSPTSHCVP